MQAQSNLTSRKGLADGVQRPCPLPYAAHPVYLCYLLNNHNEERTVVGHSPPLVDRRPDDTPKLRSMAGGLMTTRLLLRIFILSISCFWSVAYGETTFSLYSPLPTGAIVVSTAGGSFTSPADDGKIIYDEGSTMTIAWNSSCAYASLSAIYAYDDAAEGQAFTIGGW